MQKSFNFCCGGEYLNHSVNFRWHFIRCDGSNDGTDLVQRALSLSPPPQSVDDTRLFSYMNRAALSSG